MLWRDAADPRCPECNGKISPTAYYCMHCHADLPDDRTVETSSIPDEILGDDEFGDDSSRVDRSSLGSTVEESWNGLTSRDRHRLDGIAGRLVSMLVTDVPEPEGVQRGTFTAPLWMRFPVAFVSGIFVFITVGIASSLLFGEWLGPLGGTVSLALLVGIIWWLTRKPLPSDILADSCYAIALALLFMPAAFALNGLVLGIFGVTGPLDELLVGVVVMQVFLLVPAGFLFVIGYLGNRYAREKLDTIAASATGTGNN